MRPTRIPPYAAVLGLCLLLPPRLHAESSSRLWSSVAALGRDIKQGLNRTINEVENFFGGDSEERAASRGNSIVSFPVPRGQGAGSAGGTGLASIQDSLSLIRFGAHAGQTRIEQGKNSIGTGSSSPKNQYGLNVPDVGYGREARLDELTPNHPLIETNNDSAQADSSAMAPPSGPAVPEGTLGPMAAAAPTSAAEPGSGYGMVSQPSKSGGPLSSQGAAAPGSWSQAQAALRSAQSSLARKDYARALGEAERVVRLQPNGAAAYEVQAQALEGLGRREEAVQFAFQAVRLDPGNAQAYETLSWAQLNDQPEDAAESAQAALKLHPDSARAHLLRALAYERMGKDKLKLDDLREAARLNPKYGALLRRALSGHKLFDPSSQDNWALLEGLPAEPARRDPFILAGILLMLLSALCLFGRQARERALGAWAKRGQKAVSAPSSPAASVPIPAADSDRGLLAGKYQLMRILAKGGASQVWEAQDHSLNRPVAIKRIPYGEEPSDKEQRVRRARRLALLHHPHIAEIYEILDHPSGLCLVFELVSGKSLSQILAERGRLALPAAKQILQPVASALESARAQGVAHGNLELSDIRVTQQGHVKVLGFSVRETVTADSDVYSLGACLYEMLVGESPANRSRRLSPAWVDRAHIKASVRVPGLPAEADALIDSALEARPEHRPSLGDFRARLQSLPEAAALT